jgi:hypothetical protein
MLKAIEKIIAKKRVERRRPLHATAIEVAAVTGIPVMEQLKMVRQLECNGIVVVGKTFSDIYYRLVEEMV